jgi:hypothetical protein
VSESQTDERAEADPLLDFSTEGTGKVPVPDAVEELRLRLDRLNAEVERTSQQVIELRSEVETLVSLKKDIGPGAGSDRALRLISASAGIALGVMASAWFWMSTSAEPLEERASAVAAAPAPERSVETPAVQVAVVPAAEVTSGRTGEPPAPSPLRVAMPQAAPRRVEYVGTLTIDSDPPGEVKIDGKTIGTTPVRAADLKAGSHLIWIQREGYRRFTRVVQVPANRVTRLVADLEPLAAR